MKTNKKNLELKIAAEIAGFKKQLAALAPRFGVAAGSPEWSRELPRRLGLQRRIETRRRAMNALHDGCWALSHG